jgi:hypothetical protein
MGLRAAPRRRTVKPTVLCLLLLPACSFLEPSDNPIARGEYALTWICVSPEGCQRTSDVARTDRVTVDDYDYHFTSTQDPSFAQDALRINSGILPRGCYWLYFLSLFGHELERSQTCSTPGGFEIQLSIPDPDPATSSRWLVKGRDLALL